MFISQPPERSGTSITAAVWTPRRRGSLTPHTCSQPCRTGPGPHGAKIKGCIPAEAPAESPPPRRSPLLEVPALLDLQPLLTFQAATLHLCSSATPTPALRLCLLLPPAVITWPTWITQDALPSSRSADQHPSFHLLPLSPPCHVTYLQVLGVRMWTSWGAVFLPTTGRETGKRHPAFPGARAIHTPLCPRCGQPSSGARHHLHSLHHGTAVCAEAVPARLYVRRTFSKKLPFHSKATFQKTLPIIRVAFQKA